jgi:peptidylprolyl isomerase
MDRKVLDTSSDSGPLRIALGTGQVIPALETAVLGMTQGEAKSVEIPPSEAFGPWQEDRVIELTRERFPAELKPRVGQQLPVRFRNGQAVPAVIVQVDGTSFSLDANSDL